MPSTAAHLGSPACWFRGPRQLDPIGRRAPHTTTTQRHRATRRSLQPA